MGEGEERRSVGRWANERREDKGRRTREGGKERRNTEVERRIGIERGGKR